MKTHITFLLLVVICSAPAFGDDLDKTAVPSRVRAAGTLQPEEIMDVGTRVGGTITKVYADWNTKVEEGTVLADIDDALYRARADKARAALRVAQIAQEVAQVKLRQTERDWKQAQTLFGNKTMPEADYEKTRDSQDLAKLGVEAAKAKVLLAQVDLQNAQANLDATRIRAPAKGVVIDRRVNVGQTVTPTLSAPSLFLMSKDFQRLQVWATVGEKDIVRIQPGQIAHFRVDAFPKDKFLAKVTQVRLNATLDKGVVTYTVVLAVENTGGKLLPYLTADVEVLVDNGKVEPSDKKGGR